MSATDDISLDLTLACYICPRFDNCENSIRPDLRKMECVENLLFAFLKYVVRDCRKRKTALPMLTAPKLVYWMRDYYNVEIGGGILGKILKRFGDERKLKMIKSNSQGKRIHYSICL